VVPSTAVVRAQPEREALPRHTGADMTSSRPSVLIDARLNGRPGAHGLARSVLKLAEHMDPGRDGLDLKILVNRSRTQLFPLTGLPGPAQLIDTSIRPGAVHQAGQLGALIRECGADVFYAPYPLFAPLRCPCPVVVTLHDCIIESSTRHAGGVHRQLGMRAATAAILRRAAAVTAPSAASLAEIRKYYPAAPNPTLVPNGIDPGQFAGVTDRDVAAVREQYGLPERFVLTVGAHRPHKNHAVLLHALAAMPAAVSLVIVGYFDPNFRDSLPRQISRLGLQSRVRLVPAVTEAALPAVYRAASVFAFPSLIEGYGLPVLEAMSAGLPVVASAVPVLAEVCGPAAVLVPPHDPAAWAAALTGVLGDDAASRAMVSAGAKVTAAASWDHGGRALSSLLISVARPPQRSRLQDDRQLTGRVGKSIGNGSGHLRPEVQSECEAGETSRELMPQRGAAQHRVLTIADLDRRHRPDGGGPLGVSPGTAGAGDRIGAAVGEQDRAAGQLADRLARRQPGREGSHS